jgi:oligoribonuclease
MAQSADNLVWIDLEMTGLDPGRDAILEIATIVTDGQLDVVAEGPVLAIHQTPAVLAAMDEWNQEQHARSGLLARVRATTCTGAQAEAATLKFLREYVPASASPMCGNSVCQDRRFLHRLMPALEGYFHYRNLDVSTVKELARRWAPAQKAFEKDGRHRALDDIRASIAELRHYRKHLFRV